MLEIKNIVKDYVTGSETVRALKDVSISFRESELVAVLGHSGCGKTTLLNTLYDIVDYPLVIDQGDDILEGDKDRQ